MKVFRKVVETGSFTAAAKDLRMSVAWASKNVERLEEVLSSTLLVRSTRSLHLTEAGEACYSTAGAMIENLQDLQERLGQEAKKPSGKLKISIPQILAQSGMAEVIGSFLKKHPLITLDVNTDDLYVDVIDGGYDLVFRVGSHLQDSSNLVRKICEVERVLCATPDYIKLNGVPDCPADLQDHQCLVFSLLHDPDSWVFENEDGKTRIHPKIKMTINNSPLIKRIALTGAGIAYLPLFTVQEEIQSGQLQRLLPSHECEPLVLYVMRPASRFQPKKSCLFSDFVASAMQQIINQARVPPKS